MTLGLIFAIAAAVTWGLVYTIDQKILSELSPFALLLVDSILGLIFTLPFVATAATSFKQMFSSGRTEVILIALSLGLAFLANFFIYSSIKYIGASRASLFEIAYPMFVVVFAMIFYKTQPNIYFVIGAACILIGSAIIIKFS
jgi:drug/metabolite transporter (DMT)-like permease